MKMNFTETEIREELEKMGYTGFSDDVLRSFQNDLEALMISDKQQKSGITKDTTSSFEYPSHSKANSTTHPKYLNQTTATDVSSSVAAKSTSERPSSVASSCSSSSSGKRILKRKTLKYENGKAKIFEESFVSSLSDSSYEDAPVLCPAQEKTEEKLAEQKPITTNTRRKSRSSENISDMGSSAKLPTVLPMYAYANKQCDPVTRYHQYKQYWESRKTQSEKVHKELRWSVREQMLDYDPLVEISLKRMPTIFKIPRERRRHLSRSNSCPTLPKK